MNKNVKKLLVNFVMFYIFLLKTPVFIAMKTGRHRDMEIGNELHPLINEFHYCRSGASEASERTTLYNRTIKQFSCIK